MIYADLPAGATVFLDASVFIHHFEPNALYGPPATEFLERIENQEITGDHDHAHRQRSGPSADDDRSHASVRLEVGRHRAPAS